MFYRYFIFIKEVIENHLISFIIEGVYYLVIIKPNIIDLGPPLVSWINITLIIINLKVKRREINCLLYLAGL